MLIQVRPVHPRDAAAWLRLRQALWPDETGSHAREIDKYFAGTSSNPLQVLVAERAGTLIGFAELSIRNYAEGCETDRVAYLEGWYVAPDARRRGAGLALITAAEAWARAEGCTEFASDALLDNQVGAAAHAAAGFVETAQIRTFGKAI